MLAAQQDERAFFGPFFLAVPQKRRLFRVSFALAMVELLHVGKMSAIKADAGTESNDESSEALSECVLSRFVFAVDPAAVTVLSVATSRLLLARARRTVHNKFPHQPLPSSFRAARSLPPRL